MVPINRLHDFEDLCDIIAKELAVHYDGMENNAHDFREESLVVANCVRNCIEGLLANRHTSTLRQDLEKIFNIQPRSFFNNHDFQPKIRSQIFNRVPDEGRTIRRRSSSSSSVYVRTISDPSIQSRSR
ncbi:MAG: hypothetical protein ACO24P_00045 [Candidatus Nanopelagicaceae bacterium]